VTGEPARFGRRRTFLRLQGVALGSALFLIPLLQVRRGGSGHLAWISLLGLLIAAASTEFGPDEIEVRPHALLVHGGRRTRRTWTTRFERGEVHEVRIAGWWLVVERTDGEVLRYWLRSHDRAAIDQALRAWSAPTGG
jgi:hypothetical protein